MKEARLCLAHPQGSVSPVYGATLGTPEQAGEQMLHCAIEAGLGSKTHVHCIGDGAPWIADQVDRVFGTQGYYLLDFYHLCDYLAAASHGCAPERLARGAKTAPKARLSQRGAPRFERRAGTRYPA
jgi:hypothetical protein